MKSQQLTIGTRVVRSLGDYVVGRTGVIINIDTEKGRAQIDWNGDPKSWVAFGSLELESTPYKITHFGEEFRNRKTGRIPYPKYSKI